MNTLDNSARLWPWTDYSTGDVWLVATAEGAYFILALVGVWLSFSAKHLKQILANFALYIHIWWHKRYPGSTDAVPAPEAAATVRTPLLGRSETGREVSGPAARAHSETKIQANALAKLYKNGGGIRDFLHEFCFSQDLSGGYRTWLGLFILVMSFLMLGFIYLGIRVASIKANAPVISDSRKCGLWVFDRKRGGDEAATRAGIHDLDKETRAGEYAQNCYGTPDMFEAIQCNYLYRSRLSFSHAEYTTDCPFQNEICGQNQTVAFITDTIDANELGINSKHSPKFRRRTQCTPLSMEYPFIQNRTENGITTYYYYYGEKPLHDPPLNYTYTTSGDPFDRLAPDYDVFPYTTSSTSTVESYWNPRSELTHPPFSTLTLIFISSLRIFYKKRSDDPIFPADKEVYLPGGGKPWFRNSDPRARPLACINYIEVCLGDGRTCWPMNDHLPRDASNKTILPPPEFWLMYASLLKTDIYNSIEKRLGRGLIAQSKVSQYFSEALSDYHWVDEVERLVSTSHARTQINTWSIATGEDSTHEGKDGYTLITPKETYGDLCGMFKYNPPGYASFHLIPFILILFSFPVLLVLSRKWPWNEGLDTGVVRMQAQSDGQGQSGLLTRPPPETGKIAAKAGDGAETSGLTSAPVPPHSGQKHIKEAKRTAIPQEVAGDTSTRAKPTGTVDEDPGRDSEPESSPKTRGTDKLPDIASDDAVPTSEPELPPKMKGKGKATVAESDPTGPSSKPKPASKTAGKGKGKEPATMSDDAGPSSPPGSTTKAADLVESQIPDTGSAARDKLTDSSSIIRWEPLVIEKLIGWGVVLVWPWPKTAWRERSTISRSVVQLFVSLFSTWPSKAFEWLRNCGQTA